MLNENDFYKEIGIRNNLTEQGKFEGYWWLPDNPEDIIPGVAIFDGKYYVIIKLYGEFSNTQYNKDDIIPIILGKSTLDKEIITLINCKVQMPDPFSRQFIGLKYLSLTSIDFVEGYHLNNFETDLINRVNFTFSNLSPWLNTTIKHNAENQENVKIENQNLHKKGDYLFNIKSSLENDLEITFSSHLKSKQNNFITENFYIDSTISLYNKNGKNLVYYKRIIDKFQMLLSFATQSNVYAKNIKIFPADSNIVKDHLLLYEDMGFTYSTRQRGDYKENHDILNLNMFFDFSLIKDNLTSILINWINNSDKFGQAFQLYFAVLFNKNIYLENTFLFYIQAIEGILRQLQGKQVYIDKKKFDDILLNSSNKSSIENLSEKLKNKLNSELPRINEYGLRDRIDLFLEDLSQDFKDRMFYNHTEANDFSKNIVEIRNYLSHMLPKPPSCYSNLEQFKTNTSKIKILLEVLLLKVLGIEYNEIENNVKWQTNSSKL